MESKIIVDTVCRCLNSKACKNVIAYATVDENVIYCTVTDFDFYKITIEKAEPRKIDTFSPIHPPEHG